MRTSLIFAAPCPRKEGRGRRGRLQSGGAKTRRGDSGEPLDFTDVAEKFSKYDSRTIAKAIGHLHSTEKLWQDPRGKLCVCGSDSAAKPPRK
jgi:hypothetical protein